MGKTAETPPMMPPTPAPPQVDVAGMMAPMMMMMESMQAQQAAMQEQFAAPAAPALPAFTDINWADRQKELASKVKADYTLKQRQKKGRQGTVLTSPLLDEEDPVTTGSLLAEK